MITPTYLFHTTVKSVENQLILENMCILYSINSKMHIFFTFTIDGSYNWQWFSPFLVLKKIVVLLIMDDDLQLMEYSVYVSIICHMPI